MGIWKTPLTVEGLTAIQADTAVGHLGIEFLEVGEDFLIARIPVIQLRLRSEAPS